MSAASPDLSAELAQLRGIVLDLVEATGPLCGLRVEAYGVAIELEWPVPDEQNPDVLAPAQAIPAELPGNSSRRLFEPVGPAPVTVEDGLVIAGSPVVGTFYRAPEPGAPAFVEVGSPVAVGQCLALIEAMKMLLPVESSVAGTVREILKTNGDSVEFDEGLFVIAPDEQA